MNYPRTHIFVDEQCPALVKGQLTTWSKPGNLVAVAGPEQLNLSDQQAVSRRVFLSPPHTRRGTDVCGRTTRDRTRDTFHQPLHCRFC